MSDNTISGGAGSAGGRADPGRYDWRILAGGALLLCCVIVAVTLMRSAATAAPVATPVAVSDKNQDGRELAPPPRAETAKPDAGMVLRRAEAPQLQQQKSGPDSVAPREGQKPAPEAGLPKPGADTSRREAKDSAVPQLVLSADAAKKIGHKIWLNETGGRADAITSWNANEEFASLGIGHFIWFPIGKWLPFEESFPPLLEFIRAKSARLPPWLDKTQIPASPWISRADFKRNFNSPEMKELRQFLLDTVADQTQFLVARAQGAMNKILKNTPDPAEREHIITQFSRIVRASDDLYPLIDYINFKGEGTNPSETAVDKQTGTAQGWGFKQVLLRMNGTTSDPNAVRAEFADAAQSVLQQRVRNLPSNRIWEAGWLRRVDSYRRPIADQEPNARRVDRAWLGARAAAR
jgi:hypothetical protein